MMPEDKVIVFDLDDTLYAEIHFLESAFKEIAAYVESRCGAGQVWTVMMDYYRQGENVFRKLQEVYDPSLEIPVLTAMYRNHFPHIGLADGAKEALAFFRERNYQLGILTDGRSVTQRNKLKALQLFDYIPEHLIVISEEFGSEKPCPANYLHFQYRYPDAAFYYVGDNPAKDFVAANRLGWKTICLLDQGRNIHRQDFSLPGIFLPEIKIKEWSALPALFIQEDALLG